MGTTCKTCGQEFEPLTIKWGERAIFTPSHCPQCVETIKRQQQAAQAAEREAWRQARLMAEWERLCPVIYRATDSGRLPQGPLAEVLAWEFGPQGLILYGPTAAGKTRAAYLLLNRLHCEGRTIAAFRPGQFSHDCATAFFDATGPAWFKRLARMDVIFLDDLAKDKLTPRVEAELFNLIEARTAEARPILATTNTVGQDFEAMLSNDRGEPLVRRLREFCQPVCFA
jgi:hypothetical protein